VRLTGLETIIFPTEICLPLLRPLDGERPHQHRQRHVRRLPSTQDRLDDVRRQQGET